MRILFDAIVAFLCSAGIAAIALAIFTPKKSKNTYATGLIISENSDDIINWIVTFKTCLKEIVVVTHLDLNGIIDRNIKVISPEEFEEYVKGINQN